MTLQYLAGQRLPEGFEWELIVVDNNSSDNTSAVAAEEWNQYGLKIPFRIVDEPEAGLSYARRRGVREACLELLLFCDDDNWLDKDYLRKAYQLMLEHPTIGVLAGQSDPAFEMEPAWWFPNFQGAYALGKQLPETGPANRRRYLAGAGMVVRKSIFDVLERLDFHNLLPDRKGEALSSGGDSELCLVILFLGYDLYYHEALHFIHFIPSKRLDWGYCVKMISEAHGTPQIYFSMYKMLYKATVEGNDLDFSKAYRVTYTNMLKSGLRLFKGFKHAAKSFTAIFSSEPGSMREIQLKAFYKNMRYLLSNKALLKSQYARMQHLMHHVIEENKRLHGRHRESFFV